MYMKELKQYLENELNGLALKKADWGYLTIEDDSRERTLLKVQELVEKLPIHNVVVESEQLADHQCRFFVNPDWTKLKCECGKEQLPKG